MTSVTTCPPPGMASQQPLVSLKGKSLSSQVTKITELPVQALELMILPTVSRRNASPVAIRSFSREKLHGSLVVSTRLCVFFHWTGLINVHSHDMPLANLAPPMPLPPTLSLS